MKREYQAPKLTVEDFMLAERVCACDYTYANVPDDVKDMLVAVNIFTPGEVSGCISAPIGEGLDYNGDGQYDVCYHTVADATNGVIFGS